MDYRQCWTYLKPVRVEQNACHRANKIHEAKLKRSNQGNQRGCIVAEVVLLVVVLEEAKTIHVAEGSEVDKE